MSLHIVSFQMLENCAGDPPNAVPFGIGTIGRAHIFVWFLQFRSVGKSNLRIWYIFSLAQNQQSWQEYGEIASGHLQELSVNYQWYFHIVAMVFCSCQCTVTKETKMKLTFTKLMSCLQWPCRKNRNDLETSFTRPLPMLKAKVEKWAKLQYQ